MLVTSPPLTLADGGARMRRFVRTAFALVWIVPAALASLQLTLLGDPAGVRPPPAVALVWQGDIWLVWALWAQLIITLVDRVHPSAGGMRRWLAVHAAGTTLVSAVNVLFIAALDHHFSPTVHAAGFGGALRGAILGHLDMQVVLYWAVLGTAYMVEFVRRYRERDQDAAELQQALARTQLEALRLQLNPHFLFNALNAVAALMDEDVREAQRTLTRVSDLLRMSLRRAGTSLIPLWQELELVEAYLAVARVRYGDGLAVEVDIEPGTVDIPVPSFLLQPLVENALKHGLVPGAPDQRIRLAARRDGDVLDLVVEDNGTGLEGTITETGSFLAVTPSVDGLGIGLTNTRQRLATLYGNRVDFRLRDTPGGGCRVHIRLPIT
jgi:two-component system LytT family sensor kinase